MKKSIYKIEKATRTIYAAIEIGKDGKPNLKGRMESVNFDVDYRGGLKVIRGVGDVDVSEDDNISIFSVDDLDFIPVEASPRFCDDGQLVIPEKFYDIFENKYLKYKTKYVLWDGVVEKVEFDKIVTIDGKAAMIDYTCHFYNIVK